jgi:HAE1 family hydrophobic/amphiphilic exporter-1
VIDSLIDGARQRLRPILMTALATILALTPMAFGLTGNSGFISQPLAIVVIGGLFSSTLLTLILVPTLYWLVEGRNDRKLLRQNRKAARKAKKNQVEAPVVEPAAAPVTTMTIREETVVTETATLQWSEVSVETEMPLDDETQMRWAEEAVDSQPASASASSSVPEFLTSELPIIQQNEKPSRKELREQKRQAKLDAKAQRKAQKNARHSND